MRLFFRVLPLVFLVSCNATAPPLVPVVNTAADLLDAQKYRYEQRVLDDARALANKCQSDDQHCKRAAIAEAFQMHDLERLQINAAITVQSSIVEAIRTKRKCEERRDQACATEAEQSIARQLPQLSNLLNDLRRFNE